jgi:hypothetical protein
VYKPYSRKGVYKPSKVGKPYNNNNNNNINNNKIEESGMDIKVEYFKRIEHTDDYAWVNKGLKQT